jgi:hypothetical protein
MISEVRNRIYSLGSEITGLSNRFFYLEAPRDVANPYAVFSPFGNPTNTDTASRFEEIYFQINLYDEKLNSLETIEKLTKQKFDNAESDFSSLTEYHCDRIERLGVPRQTKLGTVFQITVEYRLDLTKL